MNGVTEKAPLIPPKIWAEIAFFIDRKHTGPLTLNLKEGQVMNLEFHGKITP